MKGKDELMFNIQQRLRAEVGIMKRRKTYTKQIGESLGTEPPESDELDPATIANAKPEFQIVCLPDMVRLDWIKGPFDGITAESKRGNKTTFTPLGRDTTSPFEDTRPNLVPGTPEIRIYRIRYILNDVEVGQWSAEIKVVVLI